VPADDSKVWHPVLYNHQPVQVPDDQLNTINVQLGLHPTIIPWPTGAPCAGTIFLSQVLAPAHMLIIDTHRLKLVARISKLVAQSS
jgi:hypothetical protein